MRAAYLRPKDLNKERGGQRGGVGNADHDGEFELEVGFESHASVELLALCQLHDEILELLRTSRSHLAAMLLCSYQEGIRKLNQQLDDARRNL